LKGEKKKIQIKINSGARLAQIIITKMFIFSVIVADQKYKWNIVYLIFFFKPLIIVKLVYETKSKDIYSLSQLLYYIFNSLPKKTI
jgi:hypothetical protein